MPGYYAGCDDCVIMRYAADDQRDELANPREVERVLGLLGGEAPAPRPRVETTRATVADAADIAALLGETFPEYPTPSHDPVYVARQLTAGKPVRLVREGGRVIACAGADRVVEAQTAELTDCATRPEARGRGLMQSILLDLDGRPARPWLPDGVLHGPGPRPRREPGFRAARLRAAGDDAPGVSHRRWHRRHECMESISVSIPSVPVFFHPEQLDFKPLYEWAFGRRIKHPETNARAARIVAAIEAAGSRFDLRQPREIPLGAIRAQHDMNLMTLYRTAETALADGETCYPMVFLQEGAADPTNLHHAGAFCFDSGTPLAAQTWRAAGWSAACAREAATVVRKGQARIAYSLSRPPGHHATRDQFGGYCYFNNAGIAARQLRQAGRVAVLDIDFHHGNGTQSLFWRDPKVFTVSIHGQPPDAFPHFTGFASETGAGRGAGYNLNVPLPDGLDGQACFERLEQVVFPALKTFDPDYLVVAAGFDTYHLDPVGEWKLVTPDYAELGGRIARLGLPTVVVQEGGYYAPHLGRNAVTFLTGLAGG
ncbi:MAG: hypothetical protein R3F60_18140 [bacterium]